MAIDIDAVAKEIDRKVRYELSVLCKQYDTLKLNYDRLLEKDNILPIQKRIDFKIQDNQTVSKIRDMFYKCEFENARKFIDEIKQEDTKISEQNTIICKENSEKLSILHLLLDKFGLPRETVVYKRNKRESIVADFRREIAGYFCTSTLGINDAYYNIEREYTDKLNTYEIKKREEIKQRKNAENLKNKEQTIAALAVKYGCTIPCDADDVLESMLSKNKYLNLAHYLYKNRLDWSDGYSYAESALNTFVIESEQDKLIFNELAEITQKTDVDGRYFRDCTWSYDRLFSEHTTPIELEDYTKICDIIQAD